MSLRNILYHNFFVGGGSLVMGDRSVGLVGITLLSALMFVFSFLFNENGESNVSLLLLFGGLGLVAVLVLIVLSPNKSEK